MDTVGCIKGFLIVFCAVFWVSGMSLITVGALCRTTFSRMESFTGPAMTHTPTALAVLGATISLIALSGSIGAWAGSRVLLGLFAGLLMLILAVEIVGGILLYIFSSKVEEEFILKAKAVITEYNMKDKAAIDELQSKFQCCGAVNYTDWFHSRGWHNGTSVPDSCCQLSSKACGKNAVTGKIYHKGCVLAIKIYLEKNAVGLGATCISLVTMEFLGTLLGLCLLHNIPHGKRTKTSDD
ncbi:CD63 antigen-like [Scleropages formosus]|uniref:Tetraspanin n=1 Tax=Scleropages formosus TaxID=113540 RepID=A0A8C9TZ09_SCLFO|nr:CD63 antigen-like [Scleropages formosus]